MVVQPTQRTGARQADDAGPVSHTLRSVRSGEPATDYRRFYDLEAYLLECVQRRFADKGYLFAFDLFCIVLWNGNESAQAVARKLRARGFTSLDAATCVLTRELSQQTHARERLRCLWGKWGLGLPLASAILSVLYPSECAAYDAHVCAALGGFAGLEVLSDFQALWQGYQQFREAIESSAPPGLSLRDKQRYLCGRHLYEQLKHDIEQGFREGV